MGGAASKQCPVGSDSLCARALGAGAIEPFESRCDEECAHPERARAQRTDARGTNERDEGRIRAAFGRAERRQDRAKSSRRPPRRCAAFRVKWLSPRPNRGATSSRSAGGARASDN
jgi:hypothetical protein